MLGHLGLNVPDLDAAKRYYDAFIDLFGFESFLSHDDEFAYRPAAGRRGTYLFFYPATTPGPHDSTRSGLQHLAFMVRTRSDVREAHARALALGSAIIHEPRTFPEYPPPYFATFWTDPFGFTLEAVCHHDRD